MNTLIYNLLAIRETAKGIHYTCIGENAYSLHLLSDRVAENINDYIDSCKEALLGSDEYPKASQEYMNQAITVMPEIIIGDNKQNFIKLYNLIDNCLNYINSMKVDKANENLIGNIAENLKNSKGIINLQIS